MIAVGPLTCMRRRTEPFPARRIALALAAVLFVCPAASGAPASQTRTDRRVQERLDEVRRKEGEALLNLVDAAMRGRPDAPDFAIDWRNDFLKAQPGTFVPFTVTVDASKLNASAALLYVRATHRTATPSPEREESVRYPFDAVFPVDLSGPAGQPVRISRGFAVQPGEYDVYVALRERASNPLASDQPRLKSAVLKQPISVPDFWTGELTTSTVLLADRIDELPQPVPSSELFERPYVIGQSDVHVAVDASFRKDRELIVVFLIYNPAVTVGGNFDVQVDYHLFRSVPAGTTVHSVVPPGDHPPARSGELYVTRTKPQRFNPSTMGARFDPESGNPVMAGQGILLASFQDGEYRLGITVTDLLSRKTLSRDVTFTVIGS
jgi:hypothetical protein